MKEVRGSLSVFLALSVTLVLSFCMVLIESARENTLLLKADICMDVGVKSLMAEYHKVLWEDYDLLYVDCSYGTEWPDYDLTKSHLKEYISKNLDYDIAAWLRLDYKESEISQVVLAADGEGADFLGQAAEAVKASIGLPYIEELLTWFEEFEVMYAGEDNLLSGRLEVSQEIEDANGTEIEVKEAVWGVDKKGQPILLEEAEYETVDIDNPLDNILSANVLLRQVLCEGKQISDNRVTKEELASCRRLASGTAEIKKDTYTLWNKAFFCKYAVDHFSCFTDNASDKEQGLCYELEYLIGGKAADAQNMEVITAELLAFREVDNYLKLLQDEAVCMQAQFAATAAAAFLVPWLEPAIYQAIIIYQAYRESIEDLRMLYAGQEIPLIKSMPGSVDEEVTLNYREYLTMLLMLQGSEKLSMRTMDLLEINIREKQQDFRIDACISTAMFQAVFEDAYGKQYIINKKLQYF